MRKMEEENPIFREGERVLVVLEVKGRPDG